MDRDADKDGKTNEKNNPTRPAPTPSQPFPGTTPVPDKDKR